MSGYRLPAPNGAWIDRNKPLRLQFNGRDVHVFAGDTVASAMLAQGIKQVGRSFKLHRPRGIFSCVVEEPTGLLDIGLGGARTPIGGFQGVFNGVTAPALGVLAARAAL